MSDDIIARINARCAEAAAFARGAAEMQRRAIAACEACVSDVTGTVSDADEAAQLAVAARDAVADDDRQRRFSARVGAAPVRRRGLPAAHLTAA